MKTPIGEIHCEEGALLIHRNLDDDLTDAETQQLLAHLEQCSSCQVFSSEIIGIETDFAPLNQLYLSCGLEDHFNKNVMEAIRQSSIPVPSKVDTLIEFLSSFFFLSIRRFPVFPAAVGGLAGLLVFIFLWQDLPPWVESQAKRFSLQEIPFQSAQEKLEWNHQQAIPPGYEANFVVDQEDSESYHFRFESATPVAIKVNHKGPHTHTLTPKMVTLHGIRYATLKTPQPEDVIDIRNEGQQPIQVNTYTRNTDAIKVRLIKY
ncbi:anti-sigma factor [Deltaproteobacteria bacterium TL4]